MKKEIITIKLSDWIKICDAIGAPPDAIMDNIIKTAQVKDHLIDKYKEENQSIVKERDNLLEALELIMTANERLVINAKFYMKAEEAIKACKTNSKRSSGKASIKNKE